MMFEYAGEVASEEHMDNGLGKGMEEGAKMELFPSAWVCVCHQTGIVRQECSAGTCIN